MTFEEAQEVATIRVDKLVQTWGGDLTPQTRIRLIHMVADLTKSVTNQADTIAALQEHFRTCTKEL